MDKIKLYDDRDFDYYNPKPFLLNMLSIFGEDDHKRLKSFIDNDLHYLFSDHYLKMELLTDIKANHLDRLIKEVKSVLRRKAENLEEEMSNLENKIKRCKERIEEATASEKQYTTQLEGLKNVIARYAKPNN
jgi:DNA anti-recombination protein RmuC